MVSQEVDLNLRRLVWKPTRPAIRRETPNPLANPGQLVFLKVRTSETMSWLMRSIKIVKTEVLRPERFRTCGICAQSEPSQPQPLHKGSSKDIDIPNPCLPSLLNPSRMNAVIPLFRLIPKIATVEDVTSRPCTHLDPIQGESVSM